MQYHPIEFETQKNIIHSLPEYSEVIFLVNESSKSRLERRCNSVFKGRKISFVPYEISSEFSFFVQDAMEIVNQNRKPVIILPKHYYGRLNLSLETALLQNGFKVKRAEIAFSGGNITYDHFRWKDILFVGENDINMNLKFYPEYSKEHILELFKKDFNVDTVVVIGPQNEEIMFHLNQTFMIIGPGEVVLYDVPCAYRKSIPEEVSQGLKNARTVFEGLEYTVHLLPLDVKDLLEGRFYLCGIPFTDKQKKEKRVILPLFPEPGLRFSIASEKNKEVRKFFIERDIYPISVNDYLFYTKSGGLHCITIVYW